MQFLYPAFLWGLLAAAMPVLIHLFNFRRTKQVYFTNVAFLRQVDTNTSRFRRLKHWLIMAARIVAIIFLVLAFAQPFIPAKSGLAQSGGISSFYIDNSLSMQNMADNRSLLNTAIGKVEELLSAFSNSPTLQVVTNNFSAEEHALQGAQQIQDRLTSIDFSPTNRRLESVYHRQEQLASAYSKKGNQFFWLSDFQKSTVGDLKKIKPDSTSRLILMPIQGPTAQNVFVDSMWLNTPFIRETQPNTVTVRVRNTGEKEVENLSIKLLLDEAQVASQIVTIPAQNYTQTSFTFNVRGKGFKKGRITFDDSPVIFDNDYYFVLNAAPVIRIAHVYGTKSGNYIENVFSNDSLFSRSSYSISNVDVGALQRSNLIVIEGVDQLTGSLQTELQRFIQSGGSVFMIPAAHPQASSLQNVGIPSVTINQNASKEALEAPTRNNPFFSDIFEQTNLREQLAVPSAAPAWLWQTAGEKLLQFRSGQPYLTSTRIGNGRLYVLASTLEATDFPQNALFLPILYKMAILSVQQTPITHTFPSFRVIVPEAPKNGLFKLKKDKQLLIPIQRLAGTELIAELPAQTDQPLESGYYELLLDDKAVQVIAFNHTAEESKMEVYSPQELKAIFKDQKNIQVYDDQSDFVSQYKSQNVGLSLWKWFLVIALVFLLVEIGLVRFMKG
ncbi:MAG: BatA domain-containing protein [Siphonobacter sp.]